MDLTDVLATSKEDAVPIQTGGNPFTSHEDGMTKGKFPEIGLKTGARQLYRYFWIGSIAAIIDFSVLFVLLRLGMHYLMANSISFASANMFNFLAGHYLVFNGSSKMAGLIHTYMVVLTISLVGLIINTGMLYISVDVLALQVLTGKIIATVVAFVWNFGARKRLVYA